MINKILAILLFTTFNYSILNAQYSNCALASANPITLVDPTVNSCYQWISNTMNLSTGPLPTDGFPGGDCGTGTPGHNYWISFIMPPNTAPSFTIEIERVSTGAGCSPDDQTKLGVNVYKGSCGTLTSYSKDCSLCGGEAECNRERFTNVTQYTPGSKIILQIYNNDDLNCDFKLKLDVSPSFDNCVSAADIEMSKTYCNWGGTKTGEVINAAPLSNCSPAPNKNSVVAIDNPLWFKFTVTAASPQPYEITLQDINCTTGTLALQMAVYKNDPTCICGSTNLNTTACYVACTAQEEPPLSNFITIRPGAANPGGILPPGDYFLVVDGGDGANCQWSFNSIALPADLLSFSALLLDSKSAMIKWLATNQENINYYVVEKSEDGKTFTTLTTIIANNNYTYTFIDNDVKDGIIYYRLVLYNKDNTKAYSTILTISSDNENIFIPSSSTNGSFRIIANTTLQESFYVTFYSILGVNLLTKSFSSAIELNNYDFKTGNWLSGIYFIKINTMSSEIKKKVYIY